MHLEDYVDQQFYSMPLDETLSILRSIDEMRRHWGLRYPME